MKKFPAMSLDGVFIQSVDDVREYYARKAGWSTFFQKAKKDGKKLDHKAKGKKN